MSEIADPKTRLAETRALLIRSQDGILKRLPVHLNKVRMFSLYMDYVRMAPAMAECMPASVLGAIVQTASLGLSLDSVFGEAYLIPRWSKQFGQKVAQFQIGYKGLRKLALQADESMRDLYARVVCENDDFKYSYEPPRLAFTPAPHPRGALQYTYAKALWKDGYERFLVLDSSDIEKVKRASDAYQRGLSTGKKEGPWFEWEEPMWEKSAVRAFCGTLTLSVEVPLAEAMKAEEITGDIALAETGVDVAAVENGSGAVPTVTVTPAPSALDRAADRVEQGQQQLLDASEPPRKRRGT